ncbi:MULTISPECIES: hypothetical protein [unclassified Sphingomonas]|uniref:hypothetical protein n=1 Tax=unclassified Sphingomonas TaxID=196159 RepID=UPI002151D5B8|nr:MULTISPECIES: hypothetical protein [unclassified Sphingomonas]MCR5872383.1 hypothetical protein [Sphingomonas sp. J344]UUX99327.1 hypothetical protein LRS08_18015 [Sphingomonas sp. J315]
MTEPRDSLTDRLARNALHAAWVRSPWTAVDLRLAAALVGMLALGPLLTIMGATLLRAGVEAENRALEAQLRVRSAPEAARDGAARALRDAVRSPTLTATLERLARAMPDDARLVSAARGADGLLQVEVSASDPDQLRDALRRDAALAAMRETGQRRTQDARVVVTLRARG